MKNLKITVNGVAYDVQVEETDGSGIQASAPVSAPAPKAAPAKKAVSAAGGGEPVNAPMPGTVVDVKVSVGQAVKKGDVLVILEAMKMENEIMSPRDGSVASVVAGKGESVDTGAVLVTLN